MNEAEFEELYARLRPSVFAVAVLRVGLQDAADVCSETFMVAWAKRDAAPDARAARAAWIAGIARNKAYETLRRRQRANRDRQGGSLDSGNLPEPYSGDDPAARVLALLEARAVYSRLGDGDRELFELAHVYGLPAASGAESLGISLTAYASRLSRLRQRLALIEAEESTVVTSDE